MSQPKDAPIRQYYVKPSGLGWTITGPDIKDGGYYDKKPKALQAAKEIAKQNQPSMVIPLKRNDRIEHGKIARYGPPRAVTTDADRQAEFERYKAALDRGDFEGVSASLEVAMSDAGLDQMIAEYHDLLIKRLPAEMAEREEDES